MALRYIIIIILQVVQHTFVYSWWLDESLFVVVIFNIQVRSVSRPIKEIDFDKLQENFFNIVLLESTLTD